MKKRILMLLTALAMLIAAAGCGAGSSSAQTSSLDVSYGSDSESDDTLSSGSTTSLTLGDDTKIINTGNLTVQTPDLSAASAALITLLADYGGYIESQEVYQFTSRSAAEYVLRVPAEYFDALMNAVSESELCTVTYQSISREDVSESYSDIENRLETLELKLSRLQELLLQAESVEDLITIESAISDVEYEIESLTTQKNHYDSLIGYSTIYLCLSQISSAGEAADATLAQRRMSAFTTGCANFVSGWEAFLVLVIGNLFSLLLLLAVLVLGIAMLRRWKKRHPGAKKCRKKDAVPTATDPEQEK